MEDRDDRRHAERRDFAAGMAVDVHGVEQSLETHTSAVGSDDADLRTSFVQGLDAVGGYGEMEQTLPCAATVDYCLPCLATFIGPGCCCVRSHPDQVFVPLDLFSERVYHRPLAIAPFGSFSWQAFIAYFVALTGTNPTTFSACGQNIQELVERPDSGASPFIAGLSVAQSGVLGVVFATLIGLGNSRYEKRCWGWMSPIVAAICLSATVPALALCSNEIASQGNNGSFSLYAGAASNYVSVCFFTVQLLLTVLLLVRRRKSCNGSGDGAWCGPMEFSEPIRPLVPGNQTSGDVLSDSLLPEPSESYRRQHYERDVAELEGGDEEDEAQRALIPLRFWIAVTLCGTVVGFLAAMGALYGVFLTERLRRWAQRSSASIDDAKAFLEALPGEDDSVIYLISLLDGVSASIAIILDNFFAVRSSAACSATKSPTDWLARIC